MEKIEYKVNDNLIIKDGFELKKYDEVNEIDMSEDFKIKEASNWPVLYVMYSKDKKRIYIGQSINVINRMKEHLTEKDKKYEKRKEKIKNLHYFLIVYYKKANLSIIYNLEDRMIRCAFAYEQISKEKEVLNVDVGHSHRFYGMSKQGKEVDVEAIWNTLYEKGIVDKDFTEIEKDYMYKLSPLIELTDKQEEIKMKALGLLDNNKSIIIKGMPGTGKTILALNMAKSLTEMYENKKVAIVTPITSFAATLKKVVKNVKVFNDIQIYTPIQLVNMYYKSKRKFDYIIVDESHRLKYCRNSGQLCQHNRNIVFWKLKDELLEYFNNDKEKKMLIKGFIGKPEDNLIKRKNGITAKTESLDKDEIGEYLKNNKTIFEKINQLDWIETVGNKTIYFYDELQSIRKEDLTKEDLYNRLEIVESNTTRILELDESIRIKNKDYIKFIESLLEIKQDDNFSSIIKNFLKTSKKDDSKYEFKVFDSFKEMYEELSDKKKEKASCRLLSGYYEEWVSKDKNSNKFDFKFDDVGLFKWNTSRDDWCSSEGAKELKEIGCVYTIQGYDMDYAGVIIGKELYYDNEIRARMEEYKDPGGKDRIVSDDELLKYIKNIYRILLTRGIRGTYVYVCDDNLRNYLKKQLDKYIDGDDLIYSYNDDLQLNNMVAGDTEEYYNN